MKVDFKTVNHIVRESSRRMQDVRLEHIDSSCIALSADHDGYEFLVRLQPPRATRGVLGAQQLMLAAPTDAVGIIADAIAGTAAVHRGEVLYAMLEAMEQRPIDFAGNSEDALQRIERLATRLMDLAAKLQKEQRG